MKMRACFVLGIALALAPLMQLAHADIVTTTDETTFNTALANRGLSITNTQDFDSTSSGTAINNSTSLGAFTFAGMPSPGGSVGSGFFTSSGSNYLSTSTGASFQSGGLTFTFAPTHAFSMKMITSEKPAPSGILSNDDFALVAGGQTLNIDSSSGIVVGGFPPFTSESYFFGVINTDAAFTSATFNLPGSDPLFYIVDDLQTSNVPEPNAIGLIALSLMAAMVRRGRRS